LPVAVVGTLGYVFSGGQARDLPPLALGFVHGPALLGIVAGSVLTAPVGARAAHRMPVTALRRIFAGLLYVLATKMLWTYV
ncbi:MAG TPA: TSUP family transporter, partial [Albitalea sp.]